MFKGSLFLICILLCIQSCNHAHLTQPEENICFPEDSLTINTIRELIGNDVFRDSISFESTISKLDSNENLEEVKFWIDISESRFEINPRGLARRSNTITDLQDYQIKVINAVTLQFIRINDAGEDTLEFPFPIVDGKCETTVVKVPANYDYQVLVSFWQIKDWPWERLDFSIYDRSFSALDTVNLSSKAKDTLDLVFIGLRGIKFFFEFENIPLGKWSEDSTYSIKRYIKRYEYSLSTPTLYKKGSLFGYFIMPDRRDSSSVWAIMEDDTGEVFISFLPNLVSMIENDGVVKVSADSIFLGRDYTNHQTLTLDDAPHRERYEE